MRDAARCASRSAISRRGDQVAREREEHGHAEVAATEAGDLRRGTAAPRRHRDGAEAVEGRLVGDPWPRSRRDPTWCRHRWDSLSLVRLARSARLCRCGGRPSSPSVARRSPRRRVASADAVDEIVRSTCRAGSPGGDHGDRRLGARRCGDRAVAADAARATGLGTGALPGRPGLHAPATTAADGQHVLGGQLDRPVARRPAGTHRTWWSTSATTTSASAATADIACNAAMRSGTCSTRSDRATGVVEQDHRVPFDHAERTGTTQALDLVAAERDDLVLWDWPAAQAAEQIPLGPGLHPSARRSRLPASLGADGRRHHRAVGGGHTHRDRRRAAGRCGRDRRVLPDRTGARAGHPRATGRGRPLGMVAGRPVVVRASGPTCRRGQPDARGSCARWVPDRLRVRAGRGRWSRAPTTRPTTNRGALAVLPVSADRTAVRLHVGSRPTRRRRPGGVGGRCDAAHAGRRPTRLLDTRADRPGTGADGRPHPPVPLRSR